MALSSADSEARIRNSSPGLRFFLTAAIAIALMVLDHRGAYLEQIRTYLGAAMYPLQIAIDSPAAGLRWTRENLALRERLINENAELRKLTLINGAQLQRLAALRAENARFRALLDSKSRVPDRVVVGEILSVDMDPLRHRVILNRGSRAGAYEGQALLDAGGVVGQITRDQIYSSEAILITDPDHALPVEVARNGLRTIAVGTGDRDRLSLPFLTRNADVKTGDLLVTSGLGGAFPAGYPVGTITRVDGSSGDAFLDVTAEPAASLNRLHEVLLVFPQQPVPGPTDVQSVAPATGKPATPGPPPGPGPAASQAPEPAPPTPGPSVGAPATGLPSAAPPQTGTPPAGPAPASPSNNAQERQE